MKKLSILFLLFIRFSVYAGTDKLNYVNCLEYNNKVYGYVTFVILDHAFNGSDGMISLLDTNFNNVKNAYVDLGSSAYVDRFAFNGEAFLIGLKKENSDQYLFQSYSLNGEKLGSLTSLSFNAGSVLNISSAEHGFIFSYSTKLASFSGPYDPQKDFYSNKLDIKWSVTPEKMPKPYNGEAFLCVDDNSAFFNAVNKKNYSHAFEMVNLTSGKLETIIPDLFANYAFYNEVKKEINIISLRIKDDKYDLVLSRYGTDAKKLEENVVSWDKEIDNRASGLRDPYKDKYYFLSLEKVTKLSDGRRSLIFASHTGSSKVTMHSIFVIFISAENKFLKGVILDKKKTNFFADIVTKGEGFTGKDYKSNEFNFTLPGKDDPNPYVVYGEKKTNSGYLVQDKVKVAHIKPDNITYYDFPVTEEPDNCQVFPATGNRILILKYFKKDKKLAPQFVDLKN